jgi:hypothetical protein
MSYIPPPGYPYPPYFHPMPVPQSEYMPEVSTVKAETSQPMQEYFPESLEVK